MRVDKPLRVVIFAIALALLASCSGKAFDQSSSQGGPVEPGDDGGVEPSDGCTYGGSVYAEGDTFEALDGCNACVCDQGEVRCTNAYCGSNGGCTYDGEQHAAGEDRGPKHSSTILAE